jgi:hypothetical protein
MPAAQEQFTLVYEPEVTGVKPAAAQNLIGQVGAAEVAGHDAGSTDPDVSNSARAQQTLAVIANLNVNPGQRMSNAHQLFGARLHDAFRSQFRGIDAEGVEGGARRLECHCQRGLRHSVARCQRRRTETPGPESLTESVLCCRVDRLRAIQTHPP